MSLLKLAEVYDARFNEIRQAAYLEALSDVKADALDYAVNETSKREEFFPVPAKLREYAACWRPPQIQDLHCRAIPEDTTPPEIALERLREIYATLNSKFGTSLDVATDPHVDRPRLQVVK